MGWSPHAFSLRQLQYLVAVADTRSFRGAAGLCRVAQPALSAQIAQVEDALGVRVFARDRRGVEITPAGQTVIADARRVLSAADDLVTNARTLGDPLCGTLRIGVIPTIAPYLLPDLTPHLRDGLRGLSFIWFEDRTASLAARLRAGELDGALVAVTPELDGLDSVVIGSDAFVVATALDHPFASLGRPVRPDEIHGHPILLLDDGHCFRDQALAFCARAGGEEMGFRATSLATLARMVACGTGITLLPHLAVSMENRLGDLAVMPIAPEAPARTLALMWRHGTAMEVALRAVAEALRKTLTARSERS